MSLIKKCDVQSYLSGHPHRGIRLLRSLKKLGPTGLLDIGPSGAAANPSKFVEDYSAEHSSSDLSIVSDEHVSPL